MEFYPVSPADAIPAGRASGGPPPGIVAVRPGDLRKPGLGGISALVTVPPAGRPFDITSGEELVFCHQVTVAPAVVRRSGQVQAGGAPAHVTLGVLEAYLPDGEIEALVEDFGCAEQRQRLLPAAMAIRMVIVMTLMPDAPVPEVICRAAGLLAYLPWARPWHVPGTEALTRRLDSIPAELFEALFWVAAGPIADPAEAGMTWRGLLLCALDGFQVRVPDTEANREYFSSSGTADNSSPFPQVRAIIVTAARTKGTLGMEFGPSSDGEQTLTRRLVKARPHLFGKGRLILMDRNFPGFALIKAIRAQGAHLLMWIKSDIALPLVRALPDGSYQSFLSDGACCIPVRVVEYDVKVPGRGGDVEDELYALATTVTDWQAYPAAELAACYPDRWAAVETVIGEDKSAITDAGPSRGPILRSSSPHQVTQEMWAWITATQLVRIQGHQGHPGQRRRSRPPAADAGHPGPDIVHRRPPRGRPRDDPDPGHRERLRRRPGRRRRTGQPAHPRPPAPRPAAPPPRTAHQMPPAVPLSHRASARQHREGRHHHLPGRADHLRRRAHHPRSMPGRRRHFLAAADLTSQHRRKTHPARGPGASPGATSGLSLCPSLQPNTQAISNRHNKIDTTQQAPNT